MEAFQKRLYIERFNLIRNLSKLNKALELNAVPQSAVGDLTVQSKYMSLYLETLETRIVKIEKDTGEKYSDWDLYIEFDFGTTIQLLEDGYAVTRLGWNDKGLFVIKQVPAHIGEEIIPKMQSLPQSAKDILMNNTKFIDYTSQNLIINVNTGRADSWVPSSSDMYAKDWVIYC